PGPLTDTFPASRHPICDVDCQSASYPQKRCRHNGSVTVLSTHRTAPCFHELRHPRTPGRYHHTVSNATVGAVLYAKDLAAISAFYAEVAGLRRASVHSDHVVLAVEGFELVVLAAPARIAKTIEIADPPERREGNPIKLVFRVTDIVAARAAAARL